MLRLPKVLPKCMYIGLLLLLLLRTRTLGSDRVLAGMTRPSIIVLVEPQRRLESRRRKLEVRHPLAPRQEHSQQEDSGNLAPLRICSNLPIEQGAYVWTTGSQTTAWRLEMTVVARATTIPILSRGATGRQPISTC
jgi:hypothetical protein